MNGNLPLAVLAGLVASFVGAGLWAAITVATGYQIGFMAIGVGFLVGIAVKMAGQGEGVLFGLIGASFALFGCLLGNFFTVISILAGEEGTGFFSMLMNFNYLATPDLMIATFSPMDLLFYGIAVYEGFKFGDTSE